MLKPRSPFFRGFDDVFAAPHSRYTEIPLEEIAKIPELEIMAVSKKAGVYAVKTEDSHQFFIMGHPEYDADTLANEYFRDIRRGKNPDIPENYFQDNDPSKPPVVTWRSHAQLMYTNWLNYYVYQTTPYAINDIGLPQSN